MTRTARVRAGIAAVAVVAAGAAIAPARAVEQRSAPAIPSCAPLAIAPARVTLAFGDPSALYATGGSGHATFAISGEGAGSAIELGGALRAGTTPTSFDVVATDAACGTNATAHVTVVPPLEVEPREAHVATGGTFHFAIRGGAGTVHARLLDDAQGATIGDDGVFRAPAHEGVWHALVGDSGSSREIAMRIDVAKKLAPFRARGSIVAMPALGRAPLVWTGGSGSFDVTLAPANGSRIDRDSSGAASIALSEGAPSSIEARAIDRTTHEEARVRIVVAPPLGDAPAARGTRSLAGDVAAGDVNGDGRVDLIVGHAERARAGVDAGGVLVYYGRDGGFGAEPDAILDGDRAGDRFGATLLVHDVSGDGIDDVLVAAPDAAMGQTDRGAVYLFVGARGGLAVTPDRVLVGEGQHDRFGTAMAARDLDGDGTPDLVVSAPGAKIPKTSCEGGRAYVFRGDSNARGVFEAVPWQTIDLRDPLSDDAEASIPCSPAMLDAGTAIALVDMDADGILDLAVGEPRVAYRPGEQWRGAVDVHRGGRDGRFSSTPTWAIHLDGLAPGVGQTAPGFGNALDVVRAGGTDLLVVRGRGAAAGVWSFVPGSLGAPATADAKGPRTRVMTSKIARASYVGQTRGDAVVADIDGDGRADYLVTDASDAPTRLLAFHADDLAAPHALVPFADAVLSTAKDATGSRIAAWRGAAAAWGIALLAPTRTTSTGPLVGAVDLVAPSAAATVAARLAKRTSIAIPNVGAGDRTGATVAFAQLGASLEGFVGAPGSSAGAFTSAGRVDRFEPSGAARPPLVGDHDGARLGAAAPVPLDFDGDGTIDLAVSDSSPPAHTPAAGEVDPEGCLSRPEVLLGSGRVRIYSVVGDRLVERARVVAQSLRVSPTRFGSAFAAADVNGDRKADLVIARGDGGAIEAVLGRAFVADKIVIACRADGGAGSSFVYPRAGAPFEVGAAWAFLGVRVASIGDVDRDGCDDVAFTIGREARAAGVLVAFGYDAARTRCRGHDRPLTIHLVSNDLGWSPDVPPSFASYAADDGAVRRAGVALASGDGDLTGDGVPDLVFGDSILNDDTGLGPAVEIISGSFLASICPNHACVQGRRVGVFVQGESVVTALTLTGAKDRIVLRGDARDRSFGASLAVADLDGDHHADLAVGAPVGGEAGSLAGDASVFKGPFGASRDAHREPWVTAFGDARERSAFGESIAIARSGDAAWLLVGAPRSARAGAGVDVGAAYLFRLDGRAK